MLIAPVIKNRTNPSGLLLHLWRLTLDARSDAIIVVDMANNSCRFERERGGMKHVGSVKTVKAQKQMLESSQRDYLSG